MKSILTAIIALVIVASSGYILYNTDQAKDDYINLSRKSIVKLTNIDQSSGGTGFFVKTPQGKVVTLTNAHVCGLAKEGLIFATNEDTNVLKVIEVFPEHDLCVLTAPENAVPLKVAKSVRNAENIAIVGYPFLEPKSLVRGQISGVVDVEILIGTNIECKGVGFKKIEVPEGDFLRLLGIQSYCVRSLEANPVTANTLPGNSGSPVLNSYGHVVGVLFAGREGSGRGYIVPLEYVQKFLGDK